MLRHLERTEKINDAGNDEGIFKLSGNPWASRVCIAHASRSTAGSKGGSEGSIALLPCDSCAYRRGVAWAAIRGVRRVVPRSAWYGSKVSGTPSSTSPPGNVGRCLSPIEASRVHQRVSRVPRQVNIRVPHQQDRYQSLPL